MQSAEVIDSGTDPREARRASRRRWLRFGIPLVSIILVAAGQIGSAIYTSELNKEGVLALSSDLIEALNDQIDAEVRAYLAPAHNAVESLAAAIPDQPLSADGEVLFERIAIALLQRSGEIASAYLGTPSGGFLMVTRNDRGTFDTKRIDWTEQGPNTVWTRRDEHGDVVAREPDPADRYDPRTREWFHAARQATGVAWSPVYIFFTTKKPGITASRLARRGDAEAAVVGVDINLEALSGFLATLQKRGREALVIVDGEGGVVAFHDPERVMKETESGPRPRTIRELGQPELAEAFDRLRVEGSGRSTVFIDNENWVFGAASLKNVVGRDWWLMLLAPESDYAGFVAANGRRGFIASSGIIVLSILLAGLLAYQGLVADRHERAVQRGQRRLDAQHHVLDEVAGFAHLSDVDDEEDLRRAGEVLALTEGARRISFWRLSGDGASLECLDAYEADTRGHTSGARLRGSDFPEIFADITAGETVTIAAGEQDPRAHALQIAYLRASGSSSLISIPIRIPDRVLGAIWIEDIDERTALTIDHSISRTVANLLAPRLRRLAELEAATLPVEMGRRPVVAVATVGGPSPDTLRKASLLDIRSRLGRDTVEGQRFAATTFPCASVLALRLQDDLALAGTSANAADSALICDIVDAFKSAADAAGVPYVKILTDQIIAADGLTDDTSEDGTRGAADRIVDLALNAQSRINAIFLAAGRRSRFTMGIDSSTAYGAAVGFSNAPYNLWGEAVRTACMLADSAEPGSIQVSETTYDLLRDGYVFRRRGAFYLGQLGEMTTFAVRGRL